MAFKIQFLGTGAAAPTIRRGLSATIVNVDEVLCLFDCGEGTQLQMLKYQVRVSRIRHIFISHLHGDHFFGLIGLLFTYHLNGRKSVLNIYGPAPLENIIRMQIDLSVPNLCYPLVFNTISNDGLHTICEEKKFTVSAFPLLHRLPTCGFLVAEKQRPRRVSKDFILMKRPHYSDILKIKAGEDYRDDEGLLYPNAGISEAVPARSFAYCFDTACFPEIAAHIAGVDLLYHEATFMDDLSEMAPRKGHSTASEAAVIARTAGAKRLVLGHISSRYDNMAAFVAEANAIFPNTEVAEDGQEIILRK